MNFAEEWSKTATSAPKTSEDGEAMLPESLAAGGIERTRSYLDLTWLILCGRTGFQDEIGDVIQGEAKLANVAAAEQLGQSSGLSDRMMPWMMWSLFEYQRLRNEPLAYTFGVRARELGRKVPDSFPTARCDQIVGWIQNDSKFVFKSNAGIPFDPGAEVCSQTGEPNIRFHAEPKK
jgi:hypothetical protein